MNRMDRESGEAKLRYLDGDYEVLSRWRNGASV